MGTTFPRPLKILALASHVAIIFAVLALEKYGSMQDMSEENAAIREQYFANIGMLACGGRFRLLSTRKA